MEYSFRLYLNQNKEIKDLKIRNWICTECGSINERDINDSISKMFEGIKNI